MGWGKTALDIAKVALPFAGNVLQGIGGAQQANQQQEMSEKNAKLQQGYNYQQLGQSDRQFGQTSNLNRANQLDQRSLAAADVQKRLSLAPMADRAAFMLAQRAGASPQAFQARDFTRGGMPGAGQATGGMAPVMNQMAAAQGQYSAGAGGLDTSALRESVDRLRSQADIPGMYQSQGANQMRLNAQLGQNQLDSLTAKTGASGAANRAEYQRIQNQIAKLTGADPNALPQLANRNDMIYQSLGPDNRKAMGRNKSVQWGG